MKINKILLFAVMAGGLMTSCSNSDNEFPDFEYQTVYFAQPTIGRTIELGNDYDIDLSLDNAHKFRIKAVRGGAYKNNSDRVIHFKVDETIIDNAYLSEDWGGKKIEILPAEYYEFEARDIVIPSGRMDGGVVVKLSDSFFSDPKALDYNYVLSLVMTGCEGSDSILQGKKNVENPNRLEPTDWAVAPKDYVLYFVKFVNEWNGRYLRRGKDAVTTADGTVNITRHNAYIERDEVVTVTTSGYRKCDVELATQTDADHKYIYTLRLEFGDNGTCNVVSTNPDFTVTGSGKFLEKSEKKAISGIDRDGLYLEYTVAHTSGWTVATSDTLVMRDRNVHAEYPDVELK